MNKRGFTLIELLGVIILLGIITTIATLGYSSYLTGTRKKAFAIEEKNFVSATRSAYADCESNKTDNSFCNNHETLETKYMYQFVYLKELVDDNYIKIIKDPYDVEKVCDVEKSYVYTSLKNNLEEDNNSEIVYKACLICGDHKSEDCLSEDLDYSSFETTCKAYYDVAGSEIYDGKWTDRTVVLEFGASGNFRYGINNYVYTVGGAGRTSIDASNNMASVNINYDVASKEYNVQAYDGMNKKGTNVSCGTVKIDKGTINSVSLSGVTASGNKVVSNTWVNEQVTLIASVNPDKSVSGYVYQWYLNGEKYGSATSSNKLVVTKSGTYKVEVTNQVGKIRKESNNFIVKLDNVVAPTIQGGSGSWLTQAPTISIKTNGTAASGVKHYEYYKANSSTAPNANTQATGTTSNTLTVSDNGTTYIYYRTVSNGGNKSSWSSAQIVKLDTVDPKVSASVSGRSAILTFSDNIGVTGYSVNQSSTGVTSWTSTSVTTITWTAPSAGTYYVWVKDASGRTGKVAFTISQSAFCSSTRYDSSNGYWGGCSKTCGGGTQTYFETRTYYSNYDGSYCGVTNNVNTGVTRACNTQSCCSSTRYVTSNGYWGSCSKTCGGGTQTYFETRTYYSNYDGSYCGVTNNVNTGVTQACNTGSCSYTATNSSYAATLKNETYTPTSSTYRCCWHISSSSNASKSQCAQNVVDYTDGTGRWECDECSDNCERKECPNGGTLTDNTICTKTSYTCPNGGTLSGTTCILYTCPNGGTLSGTMCIK